ncbi:hypothetical protein ACQPYK_49725 (plasmid) [Streptosporangium sp. CA-135522]|uniref:hypothetical protein n=1 Tax=Streptosporangium sp. CA-135522 TaxID=3240072 RepID=UPI003D8DFFA4
MTAIVSVVAPFIAETIAQRIWDDPFNDSTMPRSWAAQIAREAFPKGDAVTDSHANRLASSHVGTITAEERRELLDELTADSIDAGTYTQPAPLGDIETGGASLLEDTRD